MATVKKPMKSCKGVSYPKSSSVSKRIGSPSKAKVGTKVRKYQNAPDPISKTLPGVTVTSQTTKKPSLKDRIFGTAEERADKKINRENNQLDRRAHRQENRGERQLRRSCKGGSCGGGARGFVGYNKNGGATKKAKTGATMTKKCKGGCK